MDSEKANQSKQQTPTDAELWLAMTQGQTEALGILYDRHAGLVYGIALKVLGNPQEAEDLTQDIFVKLAPRSSYDPRRTGHIESGDGRDYGRRPRHSAA